MLRDAGNDPEATAQALMELEEQGYTIEKGRKDNVVMIGVDGWQKSIQRVAGLDDKTDFYKVFEELRDERGRKEEPGIGRGAGGPDVDLEQQLGADGHGAGLSGTGDRLDGRGPGEPGSDAFGTREEWSPGSGGEHQGDPQGSGWIDGELDDWDYADAGLHAAGIDPTEAEDLGQDGYLERLGGHSSVEPDSGYGSHQGGGAPGEQVATANGGRSVGEADRTPGGHVRDETGRDGPEAGPTLAERINRDRIAQSLADRLDRIEMQQPTLAEQIRRDSVAEMLAERLDKLDQEIEMGITLAQQIQRDRVSEALMERLDAIEQKEEYINEQQAEADDVVVAEREPAPESSGETPGAGAGSPDIAEEPGPSISSGADAGDGPPAESPDTGEQPSGPVHEAPQRGSSGVSSGGGGGASAAFADCDIEPLPDINDPNLMKKLSAMLAKQMAKANAAAKAAMAKPPIWDEWKKKTLRWIGFDQDEQPAPVRRPKPDPVPQEPVKPAPEVKKEETAKPMTAAERRRLAEHRAAHQEQLLREAQERREREAEEKKQREEDAKKAALVAAKAAKRSSRKKPRLVDQLRADEARNAKRKGPDTDTPDVSNGPRGP